MYQGTVDFQMVFQLNELLKEHKTGYSVHTIGGCATCGMRLREENAINDYQKTIEVVEHFLANHWLKLHINKDQPMNIYVSSKYAN